MILSEEKNVTSISRVAHLGGNPTRVKQPESANTRFNTL